MARRIVLPALLLAATATTGCQSYTSFRAADDYARRFAPNRPTTLSASLELSAPRLDNEPDGDLMLRSEGAAREVRVRMLDPAGWDEVRVVSMDAPSASDPPPTPAQLETALRAGIVARSAEIDADGRMLLVRLTDAEMPGFVGPIAAATIALDYYGRPNATTAAIVSNQAFTTGGAAMIRISGD